MNQVSGQETYQGTPAKTATEAAQAPAAAKPSAAQQAVAPSRRLTDADLAAIKQALLSGDRPLARQKDLIDLHTRMVKMFESLNQGVGEMYVNKADKDRQALSARLDTMEEAVDRMEGALRIEFEPALRSAMADVVAESAPKDRRILRKGIIASVLIIGGILAGAVFADQVTETTISIVSVIETQFGNFKAFLSPNGGS